MTIIKINAITVPTDSGDELARRFAARAGAVDGQDGFEGFELLRPTDERTTWLVVTRWRDEAAFEAWASSDAFAAGHGRPPSSAPDDEATPGGAHGGSSHGGAHGETHGGSAHGETHGGSAHGEAHGRAPDGRAHGGAGAAGDGAGRKPVAVSAELWSFDVAGGSTGA